MNPEKSFETKIKSYLKNCGIWHVKYFANGFTKSGIPDILACVNGFFVAIEVKADNGHPTDLQEWNRDCIRDSNGISIILYPNQFEDFKKLIQDLINIPNEISVNQKQFDKRR